MQLRILIISQGVWTPLFGAVKVHVDLKEEYERQGHIVDKISWDDLYPSGQGIFSKVFGNLYTERIHAFLKENANKYDLIDANFACVPYPKESFNFKGLLLFRSHGIGPVYTWAEQNVEPYKRALEEDARRFSFRTRVGNIYRSLQKNVGAKEFDLSVKYADLVHCLNRAEYQYFRKQGVAERKLLMLPNGIPDSFIHDMNLSLASDRIASVCFVGAWNVRKGIKDLDEVLSIIQRDATLSEAVLIGGQYPTRTVESFFSGANKSKLKIIPNYSKTELKGLIKHCKVGLFPSYVEGHPLAILEQLAMGIPVVAYRVPGSADILENVDNSLLLSPGDIEGLAKKATELLNLDLESYNNLVEKCKAVSRKFALSRVADQFLSSYKEWFNRHSERAEATV